MPLAKLAIKQPIFITMVLLAVALIGVLSYMSMGAELYPSMSAPMVGVTVSYPGASPEDVQTLVTKPIENVLATISGVDTIQSRSSLGSATVMVSFQTGVNVDVAADKVREKLDSVQKDLPSDAESPVLMRGNPSGQAFMIVGIEVEGNPSPTELRQLIEQVIEPRMQQVEGVASASVSGYDIENIDINLNASRLVALGVAPAQITSALASQNVAIPSGSIKTSTQNTQLRLTAQLTNLDDIRNIVIAQSGGQSIRIQDVATVAAETEEKTTLIRVNGQDSMIMSLQSQSGSNTVTAAVKARAALDELAKEYPNVSFYMLTDNSVFIEESIWDVEWTMIIGAILTFLIVFMFIRDWRNTLITVAGLPVIVLGTFAVISALGYTLNMITLMALSLSIGLLIDDAIVVRENIFRHMERGASPKEATVTGTGEIAFAVLAITLTLVAVFVPMSFSGGMIGDILKEFGITVAVAVMISLFEAFTFAPLLTAFFAKPINLKKNPQKTRRSPFARLGRTWSTVTSGYRHTLAWSITHRLVIVAVAVILFGGSVWFLSGMSMSFFPSTDEGQISVSISLPPGTALNETDKVAKAIEQVALAQPELDAMYAQVGSSNNSYSGSVTLQLKNGSNTDAVLERMRQSLSQYGMSLMFSKPSQFMGGGGGLGTGMPGGMSIMMMPIQVEVKGPVDQVTLEGIADEVKSTLEKVPGLKDVTTSIPIQQPEAHIAINRQRCADAGVNATTVGSTISTLVNGTTATQVEWQGIRTDVIVQLRPEDRADINSVLALPVASSAGNTYTLRNLAVIQSGTGPTTLSRQNQQASITVAANLQGRSQSDVVPDIQKAMAGISMPAAVTWKFGGFQSYAQTAYSSLYIALLLGLVFVYMVLASQFGSLIHPLTVMSALPLALIGAVAAMLIFKVDLTLISGIGIIMMIGLATKNSILLVDFIIRYRKQGHDRKEAILEAGPVRLRPILMTSMAIVLGMIPVAVGWGSSGTFRAPMAITVIGGVITATILSLVVVPVVYTIFDDIINWIRQLFQRQKRVDKTGETPKPPVREG
jgi:hydrophobic/amphiphilic exporter-1 (mainly G- bacteria), HAE1 family